MARWLFEVVQDGMVVASGDAPTEGQALAQASHYTRVYGQDGPVESIVRKLGEPGGKKALREMLKRSQPLPAVWS